MLKYFFYFSCNTQLHIYHLHLGIIFNKGKSLKLMRRMALTTMKDLGVGKTSIESRILGEADFLLQEIAKQRGERFQPNYLFYQAVGNILCIILFGDR